MRACCIVRDSCYALRMRKCILLLGLIACVMTSMARSQEMPAELEQLLATLRNDKSGQLTQFAEAMLGKDGGNKLFYFPTKDQPATPKTFGRAFTNVTFRAADGVSLHGWLMPVDRDVKSKGVVVFSHGNAGSVGYHLGFIDWMVDAGYDVLLYDYRGFGKSGGTPSREGLIKDVEAAFSFVAQRKDLAGRGVFSFGHSLGGAKSIVALSRSRVPNLRGVITDGTFASYEGMATVLAGDFGKNLVSDELAPQDYVARLPAPLLIVHGTADEVVPFAQGKQLFAAAVPRKTFYEVKGGGHGNSLARNGGEYRKKVLDWMAQFR